MHKKGIESLLKFPNDPGIEIFWENPGLNSSQPKFCNYILKLAISKHLT